MVYKPDTQDWSFAQISLLRALAQNKAPLLEIYFRVGKSKAEIFEKAAELGIALPLSTLPDDLRPDVSVIDADSYLDSLLDNFLTKVEPHLFYSWFYLLVPALLTGCRP